MRSRLYLLVKEPLAPLQPRRRLKLDSPSSKKEGANRPNERAIYLTGMGLGSGG
jgi:hypothetical protein